MKQENTQEFDSNQIAKVQSAKKLVEFNDQLAIVKPNKYARIHAGTNEGYTSYPSRIGVKLLDYSNGTGTNTITLTANLKPTSISFLFEIVKRFMLKAADYKWVQQRIHANKTDAKTGFAPVQTLTIERRYKAQDGSVLRNPWKIQIENGQGIPQTTQNGGTQIKPGSYKRDTFAYMMISDEDMFGLFYDTQRYINLWEMAYGIPTIKEMKGKS